jgi:hypothetical protein
VPQSQRQLTSGPANTCEKSGRVRREVLPHHCLTKVVFETGTSEKNGKYTLRPFPVTPGVPQYPHEGRKYRCMKTATINYYFSKEISRESKVDSGSCMCATHSRAVFLVPEFWQPETSRHLPLRTLVCAGILAFWNHWNLAKLRIRGCHNITPLNSCDRSLL